MFDRGEGLVLLRRAPRLRSRSMKTDRAREIVSRVGALMESSPTVIAESQLPCSPQQVAEAFKHLLVIAHYSGDKDYVELLLSGLAWLTIGTEEEVAACARLKAAHDRDPVEALTSPDAACFHAVLGRQQGPVLVKAAREMLAGLPTVPPNGIADHELERQPPVEDWTPHNLGCVGFGFIGMLLAGGLPVVSLIGHALWESLAAWYRAGFHIPSSPWRLIGTAGGLLVGVVALVTATVLCLMPLYMVFVVVRNGWRQRRARAAG